MLRHEISSMKPQINATTWYTCSVRDIQLAKRHIFETKYYHTQCLSFSWAIKLPIWVYQFLTFVLAFDEHKIKIKIFR